MKPVPKTAGERLRTVAALREAIEFLRGYHPKMELGTLLVLLLIAEEGEVNLKTVEARTGLGKSAMSRNAKLLGTSSYKVDENGDPEPGLGLIRTISDPFDSRAYIAMPTASGRTLIDSLVSILGKATKEEPKDGP